MNEEPLIKVLSPVEGVRVLAFNRPAKRNALSQELIDAFLKELLLASSDIRVQAIVVTGSTTFFCGEFQGSHFPSVYAARSASLHQLSLLTGLRKIAGADIKEISQLDAEGARRCRYLEDLCHGLSNVRKPLIAAVEGMAVSSTALFQQNLTLSDASSAYRLTDFVPQLGGGFEVALMVSMPSSPLPPITLQGMSRSAGRMERPEINRLTCFFI